MNAPNLSSETTRVYLRLPAIGDAGKLIELLSAALAAGDVAWLLLDNNTVHLDEASLGVLRDFCRSQEVTLVLQDAPGLVKALKMDGVHLTDPSGYAKCRQQLGPDTIIGVYCGSSRHFAMTMAETGADYIALDTRGKMAGGEPVIKWWTEMFEIQAAAHDAVSLNDLPELLSQQPDFICPPEDCWTSASRLGQTIRSFNRIIAETT